MKKIITFILILTLAFSLVACGKPSLRDTMRDKTNELVSEFPNPSSLREFDISEESDGIYVTCTIRYTADDILSFGAMKELFYDDFIKSMFDEFPEMVSLLVEMSGIEEDHLYNSLYVRDGDTYEIVDETQIR